MPTDSTSKPRPSARTIRVESVKHLTPNMRRFEFVGEQLADFPTGYESGYVKFMFAKPGQRMPVHPDQLPAGEVPYRRSYTVRKFDPQAQRLTVDFVVHGVDGPASAWASSASVGDEVVIVGPGDTKLVDFTADWFLLVGDMSALPAISVNLEQLPAHARGFALIEVIHQQDQQSLVFPEGIEPIWIVRPHPSLDTNPLLDRIKQLEFPAGRPSVWVAGEANAMRAIRKYLRLERGIQRADLYASGYWQLGLVDEDYRVAKKLDQIE